MTRFKEKEQRMHDWYYALYNYHYDSIYDLDNFSVFDLFEEIAFNDSLKSMNKC